jgi:SPP1 gp7 family putative phage head morphogenesis protein
MASDPLSIGFDVEFDDAIAAAADRGVELPDIYYGQLKGIERQQAFSIAGQTSLSQLQDVKDSLDKAMGEGLSFGEWKVLAAAMDLGLPEYRLDNIFRTNLQGNYMAGKWQQFVENKENRPYLMYDAINDSRTRPSHLAHDGVIRAVGDSFWDSHSPSMGFRCRCSLISLTEQGAQSRSGIGKGLHKVPTVKDPKTDETIPAEADKGWAYPKHDRMTGVEKSEQEALAKASPKMQEAYAKRKK